MAMWKTPGDGAGPAVQDDGDIQAALRANDMRRALTLMMNRYGDEVYRFAYALTHSEHLADEVRQQVFVEVYRDLASFGGRASLRAWVFGITRHRCLDATKMDTSSMPITLGRGAPCRRSCSRMYCFSSSLTVCQSRWSSLATSVIVEARHRRPTNQAKRLV